MGGSMDELVNGWVGMWVCRWVGGRMDECMDG